MTVIAPQKLSRGLTLALLLSTPWLAQAGTGQVSDDCRFEGHQLWGKIQVVKSFPDVKVKVVESFPDLKVRVVESFPDSCGKWQMVEAFPHTKVQFVSSFAEVEIEYVDSFPGLP
ncbi:MAG: hypothetical protein MK135_05535 [Polyangiaceae bacterium]|nr:hypothetical protein [Polyangiaceae bacterium]